MTRSGVIPKVKRTVWTKGFPDVITHSTVTARDAHPDFAAAKSGDMQAARRLVKDLVTDSGMDEMRRILGKDDVLVVPVVAQEADGPNVIPIAYAELIAERLDLLTGDRIFQVNMVGHTRADGFSRIARPAVFEGTVDRGRRHAVVDDHVGLGGTIASLKSLIESEGGGVSLATTLTKSRNSEKIVPSDKTLRRLREKHGSQLDEFWRETFGYGLDRLTEPEAGYLLRTPDVDRIRDRILESSGSAINTGRE